MRIRLAKPMDCQNILSIYSQYIDTPITFEEKLPTFPDFFERMAGIAQAYPYLVCEEQGALAGYAYAHRAQERAAYQWNAELSIYLDRAHTGCGYGKALYGALLALLPLQGVRTAYGVVTIPNRVSQRLHLAMGFREFAVYHAAGYKCGAWHDVAWFEKELLPHDTAPDPLVPFPEILEAQALQVAGILEAAEKPIIEPV